MTPEQRSWRVAVACGATTVVLVELLRVWLPSLMPPATGAVLTGPAVVASLTVPVGALAVARLRNAPPRLWIAATAVLAVSRIAVLFVDGTWLLTASTAGVSAAAVALTVLAGGAATGASRAARFGVLAGTVAATALHVATHTAGIVWPRSPTTLVLAVTVAAAVFATALWAHGAVQAPSNGPPAGAPRPGAAAPWHLLAPILLLTIAVTGAPGRIALDTALGAVGVAAVVTAGQSLSLVAAVVAPWIGTARSALAGSMLVLIGTAGAFSSWTPSTLGAVSAAVGLGLLVGVEPSTHHDDPARHRTAAATGVATFVVLVLGAAVVTHASISGAEPMVALLAAGLAATIGVVVCRPAGSDPPHRPLARATVIGTAGAALFTSIVATSVAAMPPTLLEGELRTSGSWVPFTTAPGFGPLDEGGAHATTGAPSDGGRDPVRPVAGNTTVRVATYGITSGFGMDGRFSPQRQARALAQTAPDVVVLTGVDRGSLLSGGHDALLLFTGELETANRRFAASALASGTALLTDERISEFDTRTLPGVARSERRSHFTAVLDLDDRELALIGTRLGPPNSPERLPQARSVAATVALLRERNLPTVLAGELNAEPQEPVVSTFDTLLDDKLGPSLATSPADRPDRRLHYLLLSPDLRGRPVRRPLGGAAGHLPIVMDVAFGPTD